MKSNIKKLGTGLGLASILIMFLSSNVNEVYGFEAETGPSWQLIYIQEEICRPGYLNEMENYSALVEAYFELYEFVNTKIDSACIQPSEYLENKSNFDSDLVILVYNPEIGKRVLNVIGIEGAYIHQGSDRKTNHVIFVCDCSDYEIAYEKKTPSWVLSHELSHFVLSFKKYTQLQIQNIVHTIDDKYDRCIKKSYSDLSCDDVRILISPNYATRDYVVMTPYTPAIGEKHTNYVTDQIKNSTEFIQFQNEYVDMWVKGEINDQTLTNKMKELFIINSNEKEDLHFSHKLSNGFIIAEKSNTLEITWSNILERLETKEKKFNMLEYIPPQSDQSEERPTQIPDWFKNRARLWSQERIGDNVFYSGIDQLFRKGIIGVS